jgi:hypothetical protein
MIPKGLANSTQEFASESSLNHVKSTPNRVEFAPQSARLGVEVQEV